MTYEIQVIDTKSPYYKHVVMLRHDVLRKPIGLSISEDDILDDKNQYIIVAIEENEIIGCILIKIVNKTTVKFRQMAVAERFQNKGIGNTILSFAENFCLLNEYKKIELHARKTAMAFYEKKEYFIVQDEFIEVGIPHYKMVKHLNSIDIL